MGVEISGPKPWGKGMCAGVLCDLSRESPQGSCACTQFCRHVVLDEADQMLERGFADTVEEILAAAFNPGEPTCLCRGVWVCGYLVDRHDMRSHRILQRSHEADLGLTLGSLD